MNYTNKTLMAKHCGQACIDGQRVSVIVHRQGNDNTSCKELNVPTNDLSSKKVLSAASLLDHSYQELEISESRNENVLNSSNNLMSKSNLECNVNLHYKISEQLSHSEAILTTDEIAVSESDMNIQMRRYNCSCNKNLKSNCESLSESTDVLSKDSNYNKNINEINKTDNGNDNISKNDSKNFDSNSNKIRANHIDIYCYGDNEGKTTDSNLKEKSDIISNDSSDPRPPLPPRPLTRLQTIAIPVNDSNHYHTGLAIRKYMMWCLICGGFSCILGLMFLTAYFLLHSYTITIGNFETVPTFVPASSLILTGLCIIILARRRNRCSYLIKLSGSCGIISALTCALVTVTTTVLHMSRLQSLHECEYIQKTHTCTCYSDHGFETQIDRIDKDVRLVFDSLSDCGVVHGFLYSCLKAIFGLSVAGVLVAVFCCMLIYQLFNHERKEMYWEQLELRCRSLYTRQRVYNQNMDTLSGSHGHRCCEQCRPHQQVAISADPYIWNNGRFWSTQPPGNFYSPNPEGEDLTTLTRICHQNHNTTNTRSRSTGWSWNRWWQRNLSDPPTNSSLNSNIQLPTRTDSHYGFINSTTPLEMSELNNDVTPVVNNQSMTQFNVFPDNSPYGVWGPPPPYSNPNPNSSARRANESFTIYHGNFNDQPMSCGNRAKVTMEIIDNYHSNRVYKNTPLENDCSSMLTEHFRFINTLPSRKMKKCVDVGNKSIGSNSQQIKRVSVEEVFLKARSQNENNQESRSEQSINDAHLDLSVQLKNYGVDNSGFQNSCNHSNSGQNSEEQKPVNSDAAESEVYFADVSSCCNMSVKNDHYYDSTKILSKRLMAIEDSKHHQRSFLYKKEILNQENNCSNNNEDYLVQCFGLRQNSIRSRLPFPQTTLVADEFVKNLKLLTMKHVNNSNFHNEYQKQFLSKDISQHSQCPIDTNLKTEFSQLTSHPHMLTQQLANLVNETHDGELPISTATSDSESLQNHECFRKNISETHYEIIDETIPLARVNINNNTLSSYS